MRDPILLENDAVLNEELMNIDDKKFDRVEIPESISDMEFKTIPTTYLKDVFKRFIASKVSVVAACIIALIVLLAIFAPMITPHHYLRQYTEWDSLPPRVQGLENIGIMDGSKVIDIQKSQLEDFQEYLIKIVGEFQHESRGRKTDMLKIKINAYKYYEADDVYFWFGTDSAGRDIFARVWTGTRVSLLLAVFVVAINLSIGLVIGSLAGYYGGWIDYFIQRAMEILNAIPQIPLIILIIMYLGAGLIPLMICFVITGWIGMAYSVRIQFYRFKGMEYVLASRTMGAPDRRIMYRYILPNAIGTLITVCALTVPSVIFQEAGLSYLGLGIQAPEPSIGTMLSDAQKLLLNYPYMLIPPAIIIVLLMLSFNLFGNGLRDAFNPALRQ